MSLACEAVAEVAIGRRIDRNGESEYLLNGNRVRLLDIIDLVLRSNIGIRPLKPLALAGAAKLS